MVSLEKVKKELFISESRLTSTLDLALIGRSTSTNDVFYNENDAGYCIYLPTTQKGLALFDPISPTSFRWSLFNKKMIFIPKNNVEFKKFYRIHPNMNEYIIRFNLDYYTRYKKCWIESENPINDYYFLISAPVENITWTEDYSKDIVIEKSFFSKNFYINVVPEFLHSHQINIPIKDNVDDIWKHWLCREVTGWNSDEFGKHYASNNAHLDNEWIESVITSLTFKNLVEPTPEPVLDPELRRLLGLPLQD